MSTSTTQTRHRKIRAVLAGGLVLGIGGAVTLAAWNDSEFAKGTFTAGTFNLEGSADGTDDDDFTSHPSTNPASLDFTLPLGDENREAANLAPGDVVYAPFWVRLDETTTSPANLTAASTTATGDWSNLAYEVHRIGAESQCNATTAERGDLVASGSTLHALTPGESVALAMGEGGNPGAPQQLCFVVTAGPELDQSTETIATWQFTATSTE